MGLADEIEKLQKLRSSGVLSAEEFEQAKTTLIRGGQVVSAAPSVDARALFQQPQPIQVKTDDRAGFGKGVERGMEKVSSEVTAGLIRGMIFLVLSLLALGVIWISNAVH